MNIFVKNMATQHLENIRFKQIREELKFTQATFAKKLDLNIAIADIERGKTKLSGYIVMQLLNLFQINPLWLYGLSDQKRLSTKTSTMPKVIAIDKENTENILMVPTKAAAGYAHNIQDMEWYGQLPSFNLPLNEYQNASFRAFQVLGDSMVPHLYSDEWIIAKSVEKLDDLPYKKTTEDIYVMVLEDSVLVKKIHQERNILWLISSNPTYPPIEVAPHEIKELWKVTSKISSEFNQTSTVNLQDIQQSIEELRKEIAEMKKEK